MEAAAKQIRLIEASLIAVAKTESHKNSPTLRTPELFHGTVDATRCQMERNSGVMLEKV